MEIKQQQLAGPQFASVGEFVQWSGGDRVIERVLVANNGIAAVKAIRSIRKWAFEVFGNERTVQFVAMATPDDLKAGAEYIRLADSFEEVPGGSNANNYANVPLIVDLALRTGAHAVWAGWGHASENPRLPTSLAAVGIAFLGPPASSMRDLGDKICSTILAQSARVSVVPWSGDGVEVQYGETGITDEQRSKAQVKSAEQAREVLRRIGYPAMIKASEGGGGKGIRKVTKEDEVEAAFRQVVSEIRGASVFVMRLVPSAYHLEVQVLADQYGDAIALHSRDCSVQRRHQKIIEEGPVVVADAEVLREMERGAVRLAREVRYSGVGTVEYLYADGQYYFLELNPRLQVEHPVTEQITQVNLPACQLQVAMGVPLHRIAEIRRFYGQDPQGQTAIDLYNTAPRPAHGHVIACRITAENPDQGFKPTSGSIQGLNFYSSPRVWGYFSVDGTGALHEFADSQFGHLFAWGETREESRKNMLLALKELSVRGDVRTPVEVLIHILASSDFRNSQIHTGWLDELIASEFKTEKPDLWLVLACGAVFQAHAHFLAMREECIEALRRGQVPPPDKLVTEVVVELVYNGFKYPLKAQRSGPSSFLLSLPGSPNVIEAEAYGLRGDRLLILVDGKSHTCFGREDPTGLRLTIGARTVLFAKEFDPSTLVTPTPCKLVRYLVADGEHVGAGHAYAEVEVMKMYMPLITKEPGVLHFHAIEGAVLATGDLVATLELDDPTRVQRATFFSGELPAMKQPRTRGSKPHQLVRFNLAAIGNVLTGYQPLAVERVAADLFAHLHHPALPALECYDLLETTVVPSGRAEDALQHVQALVDEYQAAVSSAQGGDVPAFPSARLLALLGAVELPEAEAKSWLAATQPLKQLALDYAEGLEAHAQRIVVSLLQNYLAVEQLFQGRHVPTVLQELREKHKTDLGRVVDIALCYTRNLQCAHGVVALLEQVEARHWAIIDRYLPTLQELAALVGSKGNPPTHPRGGRSNSPDVELAGGRAGGLAGWLKAIEDYLRRTATITDEQERLRHISTLADESASVFDLLMGLLTHQDAELRRLGLEVYVRRTYRSYAIKSLEVLERPRPTDGEGFLFGEFQFAQADVHASSAGPAALAPAPGPHTMARPESVDDLMLLERERRSTRTQAAPKEPTRYGVMLVFDDLAQMRALFEWAMEAYMPPAQEGPELVNILNVVLLKNSSGAAEAGKSAEDAERALIDDFAGFLQPHTEHLRSLAIRRVTLVISREREFPDHYTFRERLDYGEDAIFRHIEPPLAYHLELRRLANYSVEYVPTANRQLHLYYAQQKGKEHLPAAQCHRRFFVRATLQSQILHTEGEKVFTEALNALELAVREARFQASFNHHIFLKFMPEVVIAPEKVDSILRTLGEQYGRRMWKLRVSEVEVVALLKQPSGAVVPVRFFASNPTGYHFKIDTYAEVRDAAGGRIRLVPVQRGRDPTPLPARELSEPYPAVDLLEQRRIVARQNETTYVYDFLELFKEALKEIWRDYALACRKAAAAAAASSSGGGASAPEPPKVLLEAWELVPDAGAPGGVREVANNAMGHNTVGMCPAGRDVIVVANDITHQIGSFGPEEDVFFEAVSKLARARGLPRVYLAANSGARIGLAEEVKQAFRVQWVDPADPGRGFHYLYVEDADYEALRPYVNCERTADGRWRIVDIIGRRDGLGVENLRGSGLIAGETSRAYEEIFTITLVTGRTVGIGAYLVRLGQRTVQNQGPIVLTGATALNKVLGREVYTSNVQLGGLQIMYANGVSHVSADDELQAVRAVLQWVAYVPAARGEALPVLATPWDAVARPVAWSPQENTPYDPREMLGGALLPSGEWCGGFFDRGSFFETLAGWAKTVVCGRARLGGIPVGVICAETRIVERVTPADPANLASHESVSQQAGGVWYPDSAFKTAQAIEDFNKGEQLPLFIFANWRGFSGGMRDMFDEILKFGSYIVDHLCHYAQPVFVYIPPFGDLRGGAWAVLDPTINPDMMEMYSTETGRGGVLEPSGTVEIKYRERELLLTMHRLDPKLQALALALKAAATPADTDRIGREIAQREVDLLPLYRQVAVEFAARHDTPGRMKAKGVISDIIPWAHSRAFFHARLRRRLAEERARAAVAQATEGSPLSRDQVTRLLRSWLLASTSTSAADDEAEAARVWADNDTAWKWLSNPDALAPHLAELRKAAAARRVADAAKLDFTAWKQALNDALGGLSPEQRQEIAELARQAASS
ncbi:acetylCoA carboxylase [Acanthamoeba castellanii str. Neff]|uniref:AcetylCoA carboxylase n=1 Tax=Acanthamoeba castellanii (strain ATCC 30010 / Neff) TaxID=1257118 RepID=L8HD42_ACACF|nr:acetylCoA carboxylase [Acanthamoeba castellanii str. Neff]ELR23464.1 acetylCoA carboxylase [Acanthamoeba castellanii str. Neff]